MTKRRCLADRVNVALSQGPGLAIVRDDIVDFDQVLVTAGKNTKAVTLGEALGRHVAAFTDDLKIPAAVPVRTPDSAPALPSPARAHADGKKE